MPPSPCPATSSFLRAPSKPERRDAPVGRDGMGARRADREGGNYREEEFLWDFRKLSYGAEMVAFNFFSVSTAV